MEEGVRSGGIGESIAAELALPTHILAVDDPFLPHGTLAYVQKAAHLDRETLTERLRALEQN